jgi:hypothetical protein
MKRSLIAIICLLWAGAVSAQDAIDLSTAIVHNSPVDVASWSKTTKITHLTMLPENSAAPGLSFDFSAHATWPNYTPPGWDGPIQYTVWAGVKISGVWHVSGIIQMWRERAATGAPILTNNNFARNWCYDQRWGAMAGYQPVAGEAMIFFVTAGNARGVTTVTSVRERSNVVMVNLPANDNAVFAFTTNQTDLVIDFGALGLWALNDAANFSQLNASDPKNMVTGDLDGNGIDEVIADFGSAMGIWVKWNGGGWQQLHTLTSDSMVTADLDGNGRKELIIGFSGGGTYVFWNASTWSKLNEVAPKQMIAINVLGGGQNLVLDIPGLGLWMLVNASSWIHLHPQSPIAMATGDFDGNGLGDLVVSFQGAGVWVLANGSSWVKVHDRDAVHLAMGFIDDNRLGDLVVDFGPGSGVWLLRNSTVWSQIHDMTTQEIVVGDLDGNGYDDIVLNFGTANSGVWILANLNSWIHAHPYGPEHMVIGSLN